MKVLITGAGGQLGKSLLYTAPNEHVIDARTHAQLDLADTKQIAACINAARPDVVINAAAYTAVDRAEAERDRAYLINAQAVGELARGCANIGARFIHVSTDYVFNGQSSIAYETDAATDPINVYGASKLAGEIAIAQTEHLNSVIIRTSWVYSPWGNNFLLTMLRLFRERGGASVVADQIGAPTSALSLARFLWRVASSTTRGVMHYTDAGIASWHDFAVAIHEEALAAGLLTDAAEVKAITTGGYPTAAKRPAYSLLASRSSLTSVNAEQPQWRESLREVLNILGNRTS